MSFIEQRHNEAMDLVDEAFRAKKRGDMEAFRLLSRRAFIAEREAALAVPADREPTRSILLRSAATIAADCHEYRESERLIAMALVGNPPQCIADELRDLWEQVYFGRHLELRGVQLDDAEFQMSLAGPGIGFGLAPTNEFLARLDDMRRLLLRTTSRLLGLAWSEKLPAERTIEVFMSPPRAASFAVTFRLGRPSRQLETFPEPKSDEPQRIVAEALECLQFIDRGKDSVLEERIPDETYRRNFISLAKRIAPDGKEISLVGFTSSPSSGDIRVQFRRKARTITLPQKTSSTAEIVHLVGELLFADKTSQRASKIQVLDPEGTRHTLRVLPGMMSDIVRPHWEERVAVTARRTGNSLVLESIRRANDSGRVGKK